MKYTKKPITIDAVRMDVDNMDEILAFVGNAFGFDDNGIPIIRTLEGPMYVSYGDYIIKGVQGEFYPCKSDIFKATYTEGENN